MIARAMNYGAKARREGDDEVMMIKCAIVDQHSYIFLIDHMLIRDDDGMKKMTLERGKRLLWGNLHWGNVTILLLP